MEIFLIVSIIKGVVVDSVWRDQRALIGLKLHAGTSEDISDD